MKPVVVALAALLALAPSTLAATTNSWANVAEKLLNSVVAVTYEGEGSCSAFVIDAERDLVLTAAHCGTSSTARIYVDFVPAREVARDNRQDLLVLEVKDVGDDRPALKLADKDPKLGDEVASLGFGYGLQKPMFRVAHVAGVDVQVQIENVKGGPFLVFDAAFVGGQSGGPVVNAAGEVVAIVQLASANVGFGIGAEKIRDRVGKYFQKTKP